MDNKQESQPDDIKFERRKFKRINRKFIISYSHIKSEKVKFDISQTKNLSEGGLLFGSDRKFDKGIMLKIKLRLPEFSDYVIVNAQVIDSIQLGKSDIYETRARFVQADQRVIQSIKRLVDYE